MFIKKPTIIECQVFGSNALNIIIIINFNKVKIANNVICE